MYDPNKQENPANTNRKQQHTSPWMLLLVLLLVTVALAYFFAKQAEKSYFDYTEEDVQMLGDLMHAEVKLYNDAGISVEDVRSAYMLTGSVVLHRLESRIWGDTMQAVISAPGQYFSVWSGEVENTDTPDEVYEWAEELLKRGPLGPDNLIYGSMFKQGDEVYWDLEGKIYFSVREGITKKVKGGKVN